MCGRRVDEKRGKMFKTGRLYAGEVIILTRKENDKRVSMTPLGS